MVKFYPNPPPPTPDFTRFFHISQNIDGLDKTIHKTFFEFLKLYKQNPLETFFLLHYLPKLYIGFKC